MKILQNLMNRNFTELIKYDFESIDLEVSSKKGKIIKNTLRYNDLIISNDEIRKSISINLELSEAELQKKRYYIYKDNTGFSEIECKEIIDDVLTDLIKNNKLNEIIREIAKKEEIYIHKFIIENEYNIYDEVYLFNNKYYYYEDIEWAINKIVIAIIKLNINNTDNFMNKQKIIEQINIINDEKNEPVDILDMTNVYTFKNDILISSLIVDNNGKLLNKSKDISELRNNNLIEINSIINHYFYKRGFIKELNKLVEEHSKLPALEIHKVYKDLKYYEYDTLMIKERFMKYIRPVIAKNSNYDIQPWITGNGNYKLEFYSFCIKKCNLLDWELFEKNINPKIKTLQELLNKYMMNKIVEITPMGLLIKSKEDNRIIPLNSLSSGEKKLIVIFLHCLFNKDVPIIIDEPEISLSIIWQENLLPDLLEKTNIKQVIVATHSSAVISDPSLDKYIIPLPNSVVDKGGNTNE